MPEQLLNRVRLELRNAGAAARDGVLALWRAVQGRLTVWLPIAAARTDEWGRRSIGALRAGLASSRPRLEQLAWSLAAVLRRSGALALAAATRLWTGVRGPLIAALQIVAALIVLFEEWGWRPLVELLSRLARFRIWTRLELWIAGLPSYGALAALALPTSILFPLKFVSVFLLVRGYMVAAAALFLAAKIASTALIARIFILTKPALMRIAWFEAAYNRFVPWQEAMFAVIRASWAWRYGRMVKTRVRLEANRAWAYWRPRLIDAWARWQPWLQEIWADFRFSSAEAWARMRPRIRSEMARFRIVAREAWERVRGV
ncbi:MAG TPA: hypothetical protein VJ045_05480 [Hyphomicrobiaceae bacterium]|nr:hypothetical protein [Hyphomicrobiaceae bacterium]